MANVRDILPRIRAHERMTYLRCVKQWYWAWRRGLVPREAQYGALEFGTWVHAALAAWYGHGRKRNGSLMERFKEQAAQAIMEASRNHAPDHVITRLDSMEMLGIQMMIGYERYWDRDRRWSVVDAEIPVDFEISNQRGELIAIHKMKPDLVVIDEHGEVRVIEHKTASSIKTEHLALDNQARPYGAMLERALRKARVITSRRPFRGLIYNFLRKALPDQRPTDAEGRYLNQNGSISKRQPPPYFVRKPLTMTRAAKLITLRRLQRDTMDITLLTLELRTGQVEPATLRKTPHWSCPKHCPFFTMCVAEENGASRQVIHDMERTLYIRRDPYLYEEEHPSTDEVPTFEMG